MRNLLAAALAATCLTVPQIAAAAEDPAQVARDFQASAAKGGLAFDIVRSLTSEVGQRYIGSQGDAAAVGWGIAKLKQLGFTNVHAEEVRVPNVWVRGAEKCELLGATRQNLRVTAMGDSPSTPANGIEAEIVRFTSLAALESAAPGSLNGKIAFVDAHMRRFGSSGTGGTYGELTQIRGKGASLAHERGAVALVFRSIGTDSHRFPHTGVAGFRGAAPSIPIAAVSNPDADQVGRALERGPVKLFLNVEATRHDVVSHNVVGDMPGDGSSDEIVLMGGHLDSWDLGTGAIDDGAGVAITVSAAKEIASRGKTKRTIRVVMFAGEEIGGKGGLAYAEAHKAEIARHVVAMEADSGDGPALRMTPHIGFPVALQTAIIKAASEGLKIAAGEPAKAGGGTDIGPLIEAGVLGVGIQLDGTKYFDLHHTEDDTLDKIDAQAIAQSSAAYATAAWLVANHPESLKRAN